MDNKKSLDYYIEIGAVEIQGVDENGELIFSVSENAKNVAPELWKMHQSYVDDMLVQLYDNDLITVEYNENLEAMITLSDEGRKVAREMGLIPLKDN